MEKLAAQGNGNYAYIDTIREAKKALVTELAETGDILAQIRLEVGDLTRRLVLELPQQGIPHRRNHQILEGSDGDVGQHHEPEF